MTLEHSQTVDAIGTDKVTGEVILTIVDSWDWDAEHEHLLALQSKLNVYFEFIESGQIHEEYQTMGRHDFVINVITRFPLPKSGEMLLNHAATVAAELGVVIRHEYYAGEQ